MTRHRHLFDRFRRNRSVIENHLIDGLLDGRVNRREFLRHGSVIGMSVPLLSAILGTAGLGTFAKPARAATPGGTLRVAQIVPRAIDPVTIADNGGIVVLSQVAETGPFGTDPSHRCSPKSTQSDGTVWTFKIRKGVKFHNMKLNADDVVAGIDRLADPDNAHVSYRSLPACCPRCDSQVDVTPSVHLRSPAAAYALSTDN
jgi:peptide/nickel transport system substrate-binding protein